MERKAEKPSEPGNDWSMQTDSNTCWQGGEAGALLWGWGNAKNGAAVLEDRPAVPQNIN